jgi:hypothetical protein
MTRTMTRDDGPVLVAPTARRRVQIRTAHSAAGDLDVNVVVAKRLGLELEFWCFWSVSVSGCQHLVIQGLRCKFRAGATNLDLARLSVLVRRRNGKPFERVGIHCEGMSLCSMWAPARAFLMKGDARKAGKVSREISCEKLGKLMSAGTMLPMHMSSLVIPGHGSVPTSSPGPVTDTMTGA